MAELSKLSKMHLLSTTVYFWDSNGQLLVYIFTLADYLLLIDLQTLHGLLLISVFSKSVLLTINMGPPMKQLLLWDCIS